MTVQMIIVVCLGLCETHVIPFKTLEQCRAAEVPMRLAVPPAYTVRIECK